MTAVLYMTLALNMFHTLIVYQTVPAWIIQLKIMFLVLYPLVTNIDTICMRMFHLHQICSYQVISFKHLVRLIIMWIHLQPSKLQVPSELSEVIKKGYKFNALVETSKKSQVNNKWVWDKRDNCIYCEQNITNFTRHIIRKHSNEMDIIRFCALPKGSKEWKIFFDQLRNRGKFLSNLENTEYIKPVRRQNNISNGSQKRSKSFAL